MLPVIRTILYLRVVALGRSLRDLGWWRLLLLLSFVLWAAFRLVALQSPLALLLAVAGIIGALHFTRSDRFFLQTLTSQWAWLMRTEYTMLSLPFFIGMIIWAYWQGVFVWLILLWLLPDAQMPAVQNSGAVRLFSRLPADMYEWKAGLRKNRWILLALWILAGFFYWTIVAQVALLLLYLLIVGSFYVFCEPRVWLDMQGAAQSQLFLWRKVKKACIATAFGALPFYLLMGIFHRQQAWLVAPSLLVACAYISYAVFLKYALYAEGKSLEPFMLHHFIFVGSCAVPVFLPVAAYFWWSNHRKARQNLSDLFDYA
jgi:hypothetical protein